MPLPESSEHFLKYDYTETKDVCKHFLTLVTAVLVFSLTFSEKIVDYKNATDFAKYLLLGSWILFLFAIIACGIGLVYMCLAGGVAVSKELFAYPRQARTSFAWILAAGTCFILGLLCLIATAVVAVYLK